MILAGSTVPLPGFVQMEPVGLSSLSCKLAPVVYRPGVSSRPPAFMSLDAFRRLLDQFPGVTELQLQGVGEPLLHPRFFDMVRYATAHGISVSTSSQLTALSERRAEECVRSGLRRIDVTLEPGVSPARVFRNLDLLLEAKQACDASNPEVRLVLAAMRSNLEQLPGLIRLAHEHGAASVTLQHLPSDGRTRRKLFDAENLLGADPARVQHWFDAANAVARELGMALRLPKARKRGRGHCDWPWRGAYISSSGQAKPCCMAPEPTSFGNMDREGVVRVWNNEAYRAFRDKLASDDPPDICKGCSVYQGAA